MTDNNELPPLLTLDEFKHWLDDRRSHPVSYVFHEIVQRYGAALAQRQGEVERLRELASTCYAGLGGECHLPEKWLDALNNAANGDPFSLEDLIPFTPARPEVLTDEQIDHIADITVRGMEDGILGFAKVWGWQQFARNLLHICGVRAAPATAEQPLTDDTIREIFLANGFTIKEGQTDLKPYVYAAARELLALVLPPATAEAAYRLQESIMAIPCDTQATSLPLSRGYHMGWRRALEAAASLVQTASPATAEQPAEPVIVPGDPEGMRRDMKRFQFSTATAEQPAEADGTTDAEIESMFTKAGGVWVSQGYWRIEDADLHPFVRTIIAATKGNL